MTILISENEWTYSENIYNNKRGTVCCLAWWYRLIRDASLAGRWGQGFESPMQQYLFFFFFFHLLFLNASSPRVRVNDFC